MSRWFRLYSDAMRNPKVARLNDKEFRLWVELLAVAADNDGLIPHLGDLKHLLRRRLDHLSTGVQRLISIGLIDVLGDSYVPHSWAKFQYKSDVSTERVQKHREKRNVTVTPPETETETETDSVVAKATPLARKARTSNAPYRMPADWVPAPLPPDVAELVADWPPGRMEREAKNTRDYWLGTKARRPGWELTFHNRIRDIHDRVIRENSNGRLSEQNNRGSLRGSRPDPALDMLYQAQRELQAEAERENPRFDRPLRLAVSSN